MPVCYNCLKCPDRSYRCTYKADGATINVLLCNDCITVYPFSKAVKNIMTKDLSSLVRELPIIESMQPVIDIDRAEEEAEHYALWAVGILIAIVLCVAAITVFAG